MSGVTACTLNCLRTSSTEPKTPPAKKNNCAGSRMRVSSDAERGLLRIEAVEPLVHVPGREELGEHDGGAEHQIHGGEDDGERALAVGFAAGIAVAGEDGDEGDGGRAADEEVGDHVGQREGGEEGIGLHAAAEEPGDVEIAHQAEDAGEQRGGHEQHGGGEDRVGVRGAQHAEQARPARCGGAVGFGVGCACHCC